jgi:hypothetical protein
MCQPGLTAYDSERGKVWIMRFPAPAPMISTNTNRSWRATSPVKKQWRDATFRYAQLWKLPTGLQKVHIRVELRFPVGGRRDPPNYYGLVAKPIVDGLASGRRYTITKGSNAGTRVIENGYGLIPDDSPTYLEDLKIVVIPGGGSIGYGEVGVIITDLSGASRRS